MAPVLGIFIIQNFGSQIKGETFDSENFANKYSNTVTVVANLDATSRNICNNLE